MKSFLLFVLTSAIATNVNAQEPADALRFSWNVAGGSARQQAIGGAMGSLGGDITATFINPAGLGFYRSGDASITPAFRFEKNKNSYLDRREKENAQKFSFGSSGIVLAHGNSYGKTKSTAVSLAFNTTADFKNDILYRGTNFKNSYSQKFLEEIRNAGTKDGNVVANDFGFGTSLAFNTLWIDTVGGSTNGNFSFQSRAANILSTGLLQEQRIKNRGGIYETALGVAVNLREKLLLGGAFSVPYLYYDREATFTEADATQNKSNQFDFAQFDERLTTSGLGLNVKLGMIYKPAEFWRLGLAFHAPTIYTLTESYEATVTADVEKPQTGVLYDNSVDYNYGVPYESKYTLVTPYKVLGSISYVLREIQDVTKQRGFLTADVEYVHYPASSFKPVSDEEVVTDDETRTYLKSLNQAIDNAYKGAFNFRAGGELKFTTIMVRLGGAYYGNPYKDINGEKGSKVNLSGGLGYRNKGLFVDLTYVHQMNKDVHTPYRLQYAAYPKADIKTTAGNVLLTFGAKL